MYPYQNPDLSTEERISDLMSRMTLEEKILQTDQYYSGDFTTKFHRKTNRPISFTNPIFPRAHCCRN